MVGVKTIKEVRQKFKSLDRFFCLDNGKVYLSMSMKAPGYYFSGEPVLIVQDEDVFLKDKSSMTSCLEEAEKKVMEIITSPYVVQGFDKDDCVCYCVGGADTEEEAFALAEKMEAFDQTRRDTNRDKTCAPDIDDFVVDRQDGLHIERCTKEEERDR